MLRTLGVRSARASSSLSRRFLRAFVSLKCTEFVRVRLVRLAAIVLCDNIIIIRERPSTTVPPPPAGGLVPPGMRGDTTYLKDVTLATDDEPRRWLLVPLLGAAHVAFAPRSHC